MLFSQQFGIAHKDVEDYGAIDIVCEIDESVYIDPTLITIEAEKGDNLFKEWDEYSTSYLSFLLRNREASNRGALIDFKEIKENWLGMASKGHNGRGPGNNFRDNYFWKYIDSVCAPKVRASGHIFVSGFFLFAEGYGRDKISDFSTNLFLDCLLKYTENFVKKYSLSRVEKVKFSVNSKMNNTNRMIYDSKEDKLVDREYMLPIYTNAEGKTSFVLLTPIKIVKFDDNSKISKDFKNNSGGFIGLLNEPLRDKLNRYIGEKLALSKNEAKKQKSYVRETAQRSNAFLKFFRENPAHDADLIKAYHEYILKNPDEYKKAGTAGDELIISVILQNDDKIWENISFSGVSNAVARRIFASVGERLTKEDVRKRIFASNKNGIRRQAQLYKLYAMAMWRLVDGEQKNEVSCKQGNIKGLNVFKIKSIEDKNICIVVPLLARSGNLRKAVNALKEASLFDDAIFVCNAFGDKQNKIINTESREVTGKVITVNFVN